MSGLIEALCLYTLFISTIVFILRRDSKVQPTCEHQFKAMIFEPNTGLLRQQCKLCGKVHWR